MKRTTLKKRYPDIDPEVLQRSDEILGNTTRGDLYHESRLAGSDDKFAAICALRRMARGMTDDVALGGGLDSMSAIYDRDPATATMIAANAARMGYRVKPTDHYLPTLAATMGDPAAFVNHGQGRSHVKKVLQARNMSSTGGMVENQAHEPESDPHVPQHKLHPRIVNRILKQKIKQNPDLVRKSLTELKSDIVATHGVQD